MTTVRLGFSRRPAGPLGAQVRDRLPAGIGLRVDFGGAFDSSPVRQRGVARPPGIWEQMGEQGRQLVEIKDQLATILRLLQGADGGGEPAANNAGMDR
jgi:hypothetical protein